MFIRPVGRHAMLLLCANMYDGTIHPNTKYNVFGLGSLKDTRFANVNHDFTTLFISHS